MSTKELGNLGEKLACEYLVKNGYKILGRNYRISFGEIDIICQKKWKFSDLFKKNPSASSGQAIHFVEVKTLSNASIFSPEQHVDYKKQNKYRRLSEVWLEKNKFPQSYPCQVDIIAVSGGPSAWSDTIPSFAPLIAQKGIAQLSGSADLKRGCDMAGYDGVTIALVTWKSGMS